MIDYFARYIPFLSFRYLAYTTTLKSMLSQLKSFSLLFALVLGPAFLGLALLLFLGLGKIVDSHAAPAYGAKLAVVYLLLESVMLWAMAPAIKNAQNRAFQRSLFKSSWRVCVDCKLLFLSNAWLIASLLIAMDLSLKQWLQVPHFLLFMLLQWFCGVFVLYRPLALFYSFLISFVLVLLPVSFTSLHYFLGFVAIFCCSTLLPPVRMSHKLKVQSFGLFWLSYFIQHSWSLIWRGAVLVALLLALLQLITIRNDFSDLIQATAFSVCVLLASSLQFDCMAVFNKYRLFFQSVSQGKQFYISHFLPSLVFFVLALVVLISMLGTNMLLIIIGAVWCLLQQYLAQKKPAHYALVWFVITIGILFIA
ncbi:hypothetical protein EXT42_06885 [Pseudoalteromonas sp. CO302Y]|uniref:DUF6136 family protein n=1 Tax=unclassified Pseudoalteromonas TaxID=194690 RepID=UPI001023D171|nr:hypothetical protein EXT42_06885 [Pseudoalteromonas sp. CO302Y]RZG10504.1 hypothetical protein EXT40_06895 [Pseudoalteromonas sp. CO133X]